MGGFYGTFFLNKKPELEWSEPGRGKIKARISGKHFDVTHFSNDKFPDDKFLLDPPGYAVGLDGVILNRKTLVNQFATDSWESLFVERFLHDPKAALNLPQGEFNGLFINKLEDRISLFVNHKGTKPMYYFHEADVLIFSPDYLQLVRVLLRKYKLTFNQEGISYFLNKSYFPGNWTHFREIKRLRAGELLEFDSSLSISKYIDWNDIEYNSQFLAANTGDLHDLFLNAVRFPGK
jgi:asparagine synthetase B (glutamine-hydrolysing)